MEEVFRNKHNTPEFKALADRYTVLETVVGSEVHGISVNDQDDLDLMGICIEPPEYVIGGRPFQQYIFRTQPEGARSGPGDIDKTIYSFRKWAYLAATGNPTAIIPLYAPRDKVKRIDHIGANIRSAFQGFVVNKETGKAFLGYMQAQRDRLLGIRGGTDVNRHELIERYGFDTKFAGHAVRLGIQGYTFLRDRGLTLPMDEDDRKLVVGIRTGEFTKEQVIAMCKEYISMIEFELAKADMPDTVDYGLLQAYVADTYLAYWQNNGWPTVPLEAYAA